MSEKKQPKKKIKPKDGMLVFTGSEYFWISKPKASSGHIRCINENKRITSISNSILQTCSVIEGDEVMKILKAKFY